jgi:hypothetical protein
MDSSSLNLQSVSNSDVSSLISQFAAPLPALYCVDWNRVAEMLVEHEEIQIFKQDTEFANTKNRSWLDDQEVDIQLQQPSLDLLSEVKEQIANWTRNDKLEAEIALAKAFAGNDENPQITVLAYQPQLQKDQEAGYALIFVHFQTRWDTETALMLFKGDRYIFVSTEGAHPHVLTPEFEYLNSDGSGPNIEFVGDDEDQEGAPMVSNAQETYTNITKYFTEFCADMHH